MPKGRHTPLTKDQEQFIRDNYLTMTVRKIARELGTTGGTINRRLKKWGLVIPEDIINYRKTSHLFKEGFTPYNKGKKQIEYMSAAAIENTKATRFKKGMVPHNEKYDGHTRITKDGYVEVRVAKGKYQLKHRAVWEKHHGKIEKGSIIVFKDGDKTNFDINNLECITMTENMFRNSKQNYPEEIIPSLVLNNKLINKLKQLQNGKK